MSEKKKVFKSVQASRGNGKKGLEDYIKFLNNKYKIHEIKRVIDEFSTRH